MFCFSGARAYEKYVATHEAIDMLPCTEDYPWEGVAFIGPELIEQPLVISEGVLENVKVTQPVICEPICEEPMSQSEFQLLITIHLYIK